MFSTFFLLVNYERLKVLVFLVFAIEMRLLCNCFSLDACQFKLFCLNSSVKERSKSAKTISKKFQKPLRRSLLDSRSV